MSKAAVLFEDFEPGVLMGESVEIYDVDQAERWQAVFASESESTADAAEAAGMAVVAMMRGYLHVVTPRPAGNVHAKQRLRLRALPLPQETIRVAVTCASKEVRRERKYVELQVSGSGSSGRPLFDALLTLIWAK